MAQAAESYLSEMQKVAAEDGLADAEIARLLKSVQAAQFKRSEVIPADADSSFKPRSLVEIAFEAEKKRQEDAARQLAVEKAAQQAEQQAESAPENAGTTQTAARAEAGQQLLMWGQRQATLLICQKQARWQRQLPQSQPLRKLFLSNRKLSRKPRRRKPSNSARQRMPACGHRQKKKAISVGLNPV